jgi:hypothetical protein
MDQRFGAKEDHLYTTGNWKVVRRPDLDPRFAGQYRQGLIDELHVLAADPVAKRLANGGLIPGDTIGSRVIAAGETSNLDDVEAWLTRGAGQRYWAEFAANNNWAVNDVERLRHWMDGQRANIDYLFLNSEEARTAIVTGYMRGARLAQPDKWGRTPNAPELVAWAKEYASTPVAPEFSRYEMTLAQLRSSDDPKHVRAYQRYRQMTDSFFRAIYSNKSDKLYRVPLFARRYWDEMEHLLPRLTRDDALQAVANAEKAGLVDAKQLDRLRTLAGGASGAGTLEDADQLAKGWALEDVRKLFYKADREPYALDKARLVMPFARAFAEVLTTWTRTLSQDPIGVGRGVSRTYQGLRDAGVFHQNQQGQDVFTFPASGALARGLVGVDAPMDIRVKDLNIVNSILPGFGPVVSVPAYWLAQRAPVPQSAVSLLFPYGEPKTSFESVVPSWADKLRHGFNQDESDQVYGNTVFRVAQALLASGEYSTDEAGRARLLEDARDKASALTSLRAMFQFIGPAAASPDYKAIDAAGGDLPIWKMGADYYNNMTAEAADKAGFDSPEEMFIAKYGERNLTYLVGRHTNEGRGVRPIDEFIDWRRGEGRYASKAHPDIYGFLGPQGGTDDYSINAQGVLERSGDSPRRTSNDLVAETNGRLAENAWQDAKDAIAAGFPNPSKRQQAAIDKRLGEIREALVREFPGWNPAVSGPQFRTDNTRRIAALEAAARDERLGDNATVQTLQQYFQARATAMAAAQNMGFKTLTGAKVAPIREWLTQAAVNLSTADDGFAAAWRKVLRYEFPRSDPTAGLSSNAAPTGGK